MAREPNLEEVLNLAEDMGVEVKITDTPVFK